VVSFKLFRFLISKFFLCLYNLLGGRAVVSFFFLFFFKLLFFKHESLPQPPLLNLGRRRIYFGGSLRLDIARELLCLSLVSPPLRRVGEAIRRPSTASSTLSTDPMRREASTARSTADREREV